MHTFGSSVAPMQSQRPCSPGPSPVQMTPLRTPSAYRRGRKSPCHVSAFNHDCRRHTGVRLWQHSQVASLACAAAVRLGGCQLRERLGFSAVIWSGALVCLDLSLIALDQRARLLFGPGDVRLPPAGRSPAVPVLDKQVSCADLVARVGVVGGRDALGAVVGSHVLLELVRVSARRRLPSRVLGGGVEVVGQVFAVRAADLPALGQACFAGRLRTALGAYHGKQAMRARKLELTIVVIGDSIEPGKQQRIRQGRAG